VYFTRRLERDLWDVEPDLHYASCIFKFSQERLMRFQRTGRRRSSAAPARRSRPHRRGSARRPEYEFHDYSDYPDFTASIGFTQRGCRLKCKFCVVPAKEGKPRSVNPSPIWRGEPYPKHLHLLDNDFFGQPEWRERVAEIRDGGFKVCMSQGINVRLIDEEAAKALATIEYRDTNSATAASTRHGTT
jgi:hypothetical protein